jgi:hypothetical protein
MANLSKLADDLSRLSVLEAAELARLLKDKWQLPQARQSKVSFAAIKNDLPAWPDDVIKQWLLYLANRDDTGWPPPDPLGYHPWAFILGHRPLPWWREVTWKLELTDCSFASLAPDTRSIVTRTLAEITNRTADEGTKRRYNRASRHILNDAAFEEPPIAMKIAGRLSVLDGNHRITAFCGLQQMPVEQFEKLDLQKPKQEQDVWIGRHSRGETPLDYPPNADP